MAERSYVQVEHCRLAGLPDLNQSDPWVSAQLTQWVSNIITTYGFDGLRIDTVAEVALPCPFTFLCFIHRVAGGEVVLGAVPGVRWSVCGGGSG